MLEQNIPIDIHINKLLDWLVTRKICKQDVEKLNKLQIKFEGVKKQNNKLIASYNIKTSASKYLELKSLYDLGQKGDSKNIFGKFTSDFMNDIATLINQYETDGLFFYEMGRIMSQNILYELPFVKKEISKTHEIIQQCINKENEFNQKIVLYELEFKNKCKDMNIQGLNIMKELNEALDRVPALLKKLYNITLNLKDSSDYYEKFIAIIASCDQSKKCLGERLSKLKFLYKTSDKKYPDQEQMSKISSDVTSHIDDDTSGIEIVEEGNMKDMLAGSDNGTQKDEKFDFFAAKRQQFESYPLGNQEYRASLKNEVEELEAFLRERMIQILTQDQSGSNMLFQQIASTHPNFAHLIEGECEDRLNQLLKPVLEWLQFLELPEEKNLFMILNQRDFVQKQCQLLDHKLSMCGKMEEAQSMTALKRKECEEMLENLGKQYDLLMKHNKEIKQKMEKEISTRYQNRPVNIIGM